MQVISNFWVDDPILIKNSFVTQKCHRNPGVNHPCSCSIGHMGVGGMILNDIHFKTQNTGIIDSKQMNI